MPSSRGSSQPRDQTQISHNWGGFFFEGSLQSENAFTQIVGKKEGSSALIANDLEQQQVELKQQESTCQLLSSEEEQEEISW